MRLVYGFFPRLLALAWFLSLSNAQAQRLDETWRLRINGQTVAVQPDGSFLIPDVGTPPRLNPDLPQPTGSAPIDRQRLIGFRIDRLNATYVYTEPIPVTAGAVVTLNPSQLIFSELLPSIVTELSLKTDGELPLRIGQSIQARTRAIKADGSRTDVTASTANTVYRSSDPSIASVSVDGRIAAHAAGTVHVSSIHDGITASIPVRVEAPLSFRTIVGFVLNAEQLPQAGVTVHVPGTDRTAITDSLGLYSVSGIPTSLETPRVRVVNQDSTLLLGDTAVLDASASPLDGGILTVRTIQEYYRLPCTDADGDCLPDEIELLLELDPANHDSDGDGVSDGFEDTDGDRLANWLELAIGSQPHLFDSDGDGLGDGQEILDYRSVPYLADTDGNGVSDRLQDSDGDGLIDLQEDRNGNYRVDAGETDPLRIDTDGDGVTDAQELRDGTSPLNLYAYEPVKLGHYSFDTAQFTNFLGQPPIVNGGGFPLTSLNERAGLAFHASNASRLTYPIIDAENRIHFNLLRGSVRFWFRPSNWSSGADSGYFGSRLIDIGTFDPERTDNDGWWGIYLNELRTRIYLGSQKPGSTKVNLYLESEVIRFQAGQWYDILISWGPRLTYPYGSHDADREQTHANTFLYINGRRLGIGTGIDPDWLPNRKALAMGFTLGNQRNGGLSAEGLFDELSVYNYPLRSWNSRLQNSYSWSARADRAANTIFLERAFPIDVSTLPPVQIFRRSLGQADWGSPLVSDYFAPFFLDRNVELGVPYEYRILDTSTIDRHPNRPTVRQQFLTAAIELPPVHERGRVILIVETSLAESLNLEIITLQQDLIGDGWEVVTHLAPRHDSADSRRNAEEIERLHSLIQSSSAPHKTNVVFLLGHVPVPLAGTIAADGHDSTPENRPDHSGAWSADGFYGSTNRTYWTDVGPNAVVNLDNPVNSNYPGDGKFDQNFLPQPFGHAVGRVDFAELPAFTEARFLPGFPGLDDRAVEIELLRQYLHKNHRYRQGELRFQPRFSGFLGFLGLDQQNDNSLETRHLTTSLYGYDESRYIQLRPYSQRISYQLAYHEMNSFFSGTVLGWDYDDNSLIYRHAVEDLTVPEHEPAVGFHFAFGSYFGDWNLGPDNWMKALLALPNSGLAALYYPPGRWRLEKLGLGAPLAVGMQEFNDRTKYFNYTVQPDGSVTASYQLFQSPPRMLSILGDPTLRFQILPPPAEPQAIEQDGVLLTWEPSPNGEAHYYVYRSVNGFTGPFVLLNAAEPTTTNRFHDTQAPSGDKLYRIRAGATHRTGSGSFVNLSQGVFVAVP